MNKLEMAHQMACAMMASNDGYTIGGAIECAWEYADAMQKEWDDREKLEAAKKRKELRELLNADNTFVEKEGMHFDDVATLCNTYTSPEEWQPDWSQAPDGLDWFCIGSRSRIGFFCNIEPKIVKDHYWFIGEGAKKIHNHNYEGDWRYSVRKRP